MSQGMSFIKKLPNGIHPGMKIVVKGRTDSEDTVFSVNLAHNISGANIDECDIAFHARFDLFGESNLSIVRNTMEDGGWQHEERETPSFPFHRDTTYEIEIHVEPNCYMLFVNKNFMVSYNHRMENFETINTVMVKGETALMSVETSG